MNTTGNLSEAGRIIPRSKKKPYLIPEKLDSGYGKEKKLKDKVALITGGDSSLAQCIALHYAREGASVALAYMGPYSEAERTQKLVKETGQCCLIINGNVSNRYFCEHAVEQCLEVFGKLDILVNNCAVPNEDILTGVKKMPDRFIKVEELLRSYKNFSGCAEKHMDKGGVIINTAADSWHASGTGMPLTFGIENAITELTREFARELRNKNAGIKVYAVVPWSAPERSIIQKPTQIQDDEGSLEAVGLFSTTGSAYTELVSGNKKYESGTIIKLN
ncbi:SDR family oxidoreductase [Robertkochia aurantiaca]|uniref:SDR family oxidoreductase n=1 Tax=Robertkochia aurantiaca TaxID=2873700 RepID=UPI001CCDEA6F|nr:SDR family oxidoreductase [Robertkochia sp. 3YJGBD-33]